ncbi:MAG: alpha/beta hydrolase [Planctomycetota bacterium]
MPSPLRLAALLAAAYVLACAALFLLQRRMLFPAPPAHAPTGGPPIPGLPLIAVETDGGGHCAYAPAARPGAPTVVHFHGNAEDVSQQASLALAVLGDGFGFLSVEYPGYGRLSDRSPSEDGLYAAGRAALDWLAGEGTRAEDVLLLGRSLGCGPAVQMAMEKRGPALVLVSPFASVPAMARRIAPFAPTALLVRDRFDNLGKAPGIALPALVMHGDVDEVIPFAQGRAVGEAFPAGEFRVLHGVGHNDVDVVSLVPPALRDLEQRRGR